jgi:3-hydroxyacyl-[acyl-carrier-protein] dehydratase
MTSPADLIPHRAPFRLVDRVVSIEGDRVEAEKRVTAGDPLSRGELPELLLLEALAQTAACLNAGQRGAHRGVLVGASRFEFHERPRAGDTLRLAATRTAALGALLRFEGLASVEGRVVARGELTVALEPL